LNRALTLATVLSLGPITGVLVALAMHYLMVRRYGMAGLCIVGIGEAFYGLTAAAGYMIHLFAATVAGA
jgi:hypothetical protein